MPAVPLIVAVGVVGASAYFAEDAIDATARAAKWGAIAGGVYIAGRWMKAW